METESGWKVLVVDQASVRIMSAACRMFDISDEGVTVVENITLDRQPMPDMEAIYFISPTVEVQTSSSTQHRSLACKTTGQIGCHRVE